MRPFTSFISIAIALIAAGLGNTAEIAGYHVDKTVLYLGAGCLLAGLAFMNRMARLAQTVLMLSVLWFMVNHFNLLSSLNRSY